jgi:serine/threonine protein kinase
VAIKVLRGGSTSKPDFLETLIQRLHEHGKIWQQFDHPHVAHFYGLAFNCGNLPALILTFYPNGNIVEYLKQAPKPIPSKLFLVSTSISSVLHQ